MVEAANLRDEFRGWTESARDAKVAAMADVIESHNLWSISCHLKLSQFDAIVRPVVPHDLRHPYYFCLNAITSALARWHAAEHWDGSIDFVFDEKSEAGPEIQILRASVRESLDPLARSIIGQITHEDDKRVLPLQAADMFAWHVRRAGESRNATEERYPHGKLIGPLYARMDIGSRVLREIANRMRNVPNVEMTWTKKGSIRKLMKDDPEGVLRDFERSFKRPTLWARLLQMLRRK
jgi:hypothetical protein